MVVVPFNLPESSNILVVGAGGGFEFVCGLPIVFELEARGHSVHIANYSFSDLKSVGNAKWHSDHLVEVAAESTGNPDYFPERDIAAWYKERRNVERSVWCLDKSGLEETLRSYRLLQNRLDIQAVVCVDGGVDGLFCGDECDLGTPSMDAISVIATHLCEAPVRVYASVGFGTEGAEGTVSHAQALQRMAELMASRASLGVGLIHNNLPHSAEFFDAVSFVFSRMPTVRRSIMVSSLIAAVRGEFGRRVVHPKTVERPPWVSPLTALIWYFEADAVARAKPYYADALRTKTVSEMAALIEATRNRMGVRQFESIPI
jgi:hypothetical protein